MSNETKGEEPKQAIALVPVSLDPQALIQSAIKHGSGIETLERLFALAKDVRAQQARERWHAAMAEFQRTCPAIKQTRTANVASRRTGGSYSYRYAPLAEIMKTILPAMGRLGLSVSFRKQHENDRVIASCRVSHEMGHYEESGNVVIPVVSDEGSGANAAQRVGIASTYAKRYALLAITGLAPEDVPEAHGRGEPRQPRARASERAPEEKPGPPGRPVRVWRGQILRVSERSGGHDGGTWTLYTITSDDDQKFETDKRSIAEAAKNAGSRLVEIDWEETDRGPKKILGMKMLSKPPERRAENGGSSPQGD